MKMKVRLSFIAALACVASAMGWMAGCGSGRQTVPTAATSTAAYVQTVVVKGNLALNAPGQTSQLTAEATLSDGSKKDVTSTTQWSSSNINVARVAGGLVTAVDFGKAYINASGYVSAPITVLPVGTYILSGRVTEAGTFPLSGVRVELVGGPMSGRTALTDDGGNYAFNGVSGVLQVRASRADYMTATQNVSGDTEHMNIDLTGSAPYASLGGVYQLTFKASSACRLPDDAVNRTYRAGIDQKSPGAALAVVLLGGQFGSIAYVNGGTLTLNTFAGRVQGTTVTFTLDDSYDAFYTGSGVVEKLADNRYLSLVGTADATATVSGITAVFAGTVKVSPSVDFYGPAIATCTAADHQLNFSQVAGTPSRRRF